MIVMFKFWLSTFCYNVPVMQYDQQVSGKLFEIRFGKSDVGESLFRRDWCCFYSSCRFEHNFCGKLCVLTVNCVIFGAVEETYGGLWFLCRVCTGNEKSFERKMSRFVVWMNYEGKVGIGSKVLQLLFSLWDNIFSTLPVQTLHSPFLIFTQTKN